MARFVTEFGAQAVPDDRRLLRARALARPRLGAPRPHATRCSRPLFDRHVPPGRPRHLRRVARRPPRRTRPRSSRRHIEALRRIKYRPTGGFAQFCFADGHPAVTWSVLGHDRAPEARLRRAARGLPAGDRRRRPPARRGRPPGEALALDVHVVSDLRAPVDDAEVTAHAALDRRQPHAGAGAATSPPTAASASAPSRSSCPTRPGRSRSSSRCRPRRRAGRQPLRGDDRLTRRAPDLGVCGFRTV